MRRAKDCHVKKVAMQTKLLRNQVTTCSLDKTLQFYVNSFGNKELLLHQVQGLQAHITEKEEGFGSFNL